MYYINISYTPVYKQSYKLNGFHCFFFTSPRSFRSVSYFTLRVPITGWGISGALLPPAATSNAADFSGMPRIHPSKAARPNSDGFGAVRYFHVLVDRRADFLEKFLCWGCWMFLLLKKEEPKVELFGWDVQASVYTPSLQNTCWSSVFWAQIPPKTRCLEA